jgi:galactokinase
MIDYLALADTFESEFGEMPRLFSAPGRVNLIGEHTDYNDGFVLPVAIDMRTVVAGIPRDDRRVIVRSLDMDETAEFDLDIPGETRRGLWIDYVEGVARMLEARGIALGGANLILESDVPVGSGLSSSAALEISTGFALISLAEGTLDRVELALAGQLAEHIHVGTMVGIMDQYISALGQEGHALLIDCRTLEYTAVPFDTSRCSIVICNTKVEHELATSEYNTRRRECSEGVDLLQGALPEILALRDVTPEQLERNRELLPETIYRRCRHVVTENRRTEQAAEALKRGDFTEMGRLMAASHLSLRDDYEVSCPELDVLVEIASSVPGVFGARMTGGGFGGCTVNIVERSAVEALRAAVMTEYPMRTGIEPEVYVSSAAGGASEVEV